MKLDVAYLLILCNGNKLISSYSSNFTNLSFVKLPETIDWLQMTIDFFLEVNIPSQIFRYGHVKYINECVLIRKNCKILELYVPLC